MAIELSIVSLYIMTKVDFIYSKYLYASIGSIFSYCQHFAACGSINLYQRYHVTLFHDTKMGVILHSCRSRRFAAMYNAAIGFFFVLLLLHTSEHH